MSWVESEKLYFVLLGFYRVFTEFYSIQPNLIDIYQILSIFTHLLELQ